MAEQASIVIANETEFELLTGAGLDRLDAAMADWARSQNQTVIVTLGGDFALPARAVTPSSAVPSSAGPSSAAPAATAASEPAQNVTTRPARGDHSVGRGWWPWAMGGVVGVGALGVLVRSLRRR